MTYTTYAEYLQTPQFRAVRSKVMNRANKMCEADVMHHDGPGRCGKPATEVHHIRYCKWGEYDTPSNLIAVCHECHEDAHRCDTCGQVVLKAEHIKSGQTTCFNCYVDNNEN